VRASARARAIRFGTKAKAKSRKEIYRIVYIDLQYRGTIFKCRDCGVGVGQAIRCRYLL
jgi:predicted RNA-binding Zn-ribbon protein involved in translation (DUF1610 family)